MFRPIASVLAFFVLQPSLHTSADNIAEEEYSLALKSAIAVMAKGEAEGADQANQSLHMAARCLFLKSRAPLEVMARINEKVVSDKSDRDHLTDLSHAGEGSNVLGVNHTPCVSEQYAINPDIKDKLISQLYSQESDSVYLQL